MGMTSFTPLSAGKPARSSIGIFGSGELTFSNTDSGAFVVPVSPALTPERIVVHQAASKAGVSTKSMQFVSGNLPAELDIYGTVSEGPSNFDRCVTVSITSFGSGTVSGTIVSNTLNAGETAKIALTAFGSAVQSIASGSVNFNGSSSGAFDIDLDQQMTPVTAFLNQGATQQGISLGAIILQNANLPANVEVLGQNDKRMVIQITGFASGKIQGSIVSNDLDTDMASVVAVAFSS